MLKGIGDDRYAEGLLFHIKNREADAVQTDGSLFNNEGSEFFMQLKTVFPASVQRFF